MSDFPSIDELIEALMEDNNPAVRAEAARLIGEMSHTLNAEDRDFAKKALNRAMIDPDPTVLMSVMNAIGRFPTIVEDDDEDDDYIEGYDEDTIPVRAAACILCGKPTALIEPATCPNEQCPYK